MEAVQDNRQPQSSEMQSETPRERSGVLSRIRSWGSNLRGAILGDRRQDNIPPTAGSRSFRNPVKLADQRLAPDSSLGRQPEPRSSTEGIERLLGPTTDSPPQGSVATGLSGQTVNSFTHTHMSEPLIVADERPVEQVLDLLGYAEGPPLEQNNFTHRYHQEYVGQSSLLNISEINTPRRSSSLGSIMGTSLTLPDKPGGSAPSSQCRRPTRQAPSINQRAPNAILLGDARISPTREGSYAFARRVEQSIITPVDRSRSHHALIEQTTPPPLPQDERGGNAHELPRQRTHLRFTSTEAGSPRITQHPQTLTERIRRIERRLGLPHDSTKSLESRVERIEHLLDIQDEGH